MPSIFDEARSYGQQIGEQRKAIRELTDAAWWRGFAWGCIAGSLIASTVYVVAVFAMGSPRLP